MRTIEVSEAELEHVTASELFAKPAARKADALPSDEEEADEVFFKRRTFDRNPGLFGDLNKMKEDMRNEPTYDVKDFYHKAGFWQAIARSHTFEHLTLGVIAFNAFWMAVDTDNNTAETLLQAEPIFQVAEHGFCAFFSFEWLCRYMSFERKRNGLRDGWFVFDSLLVFMMVAESWVLSLFMAVVSPSDPGGGSPLGNASILRLFRLARLSRMARMLRCMPELLILIKGMVAAMRSVGFVLLLLIIIMYLFSIAFVQLLAGTEAGTEYFPGILPSMFTLVCSGTFLDNLTRVASDIGRSSMPCAGLFLIFIGLSALLLMNMLIGVLCEVVSQVAAVEQEQMLVHIVSEKITAIFDGIDKDKSGVLSKKEFEQILKNRDAWDALEEIEVDPIALAKLSDQIFKTDPEAEGETVLKMEEFLDLIIQFRGSNNATVKDMTDLRGYVESQMRRHHKDSMRYLRHLAPEMAERERQKQWAVNSARRRLSLQSLQSSFE